MNVISEDYAKEKCFFEDLTEGKVFVMNLIVISFPIQLFAVFKRIQMIIVY